MLTFYDSGIGGITIVKEYLKIRPNSLFQYFGDFSILPMGDKSSKQIMEQIKSVATTVFANSNLLVLACNTASVNTIRELQKNWLPTYFADKQILSISKPITELLQSQYSNFKHQELVVLATQATIDSGFYQQEFAQIGFKKVVAVACPGLCDLIENLVDQQQVGSPPNKNSQLLTKEFIDNLILQIDRLPRLTSEIAVYLIKLKLPPKALILLACTHYPIIKDMIALVYPKSSIVDPSHFIAQKLLEYQSKHPKYR